MKLFLDRAQAVHHRFIADDAGREIISEICRKVDRLPLGIELAAAHVRMLPLAELARRLVDEGSAALRHGQGDLLLEAGSRHRSLYATIDWSFKLVGPAPQVLLARLSVFRGSFDLAAVESVCSDSAAPDTSNAGEESLFDVLWELVDFHLVEPIKHGDNQIRFALLDSVRDFAASHLRGLGQEQHLRTRHAEHFLTLMLQAGLGLESAEEAYWSGRIDDDLDELRAALDWLNDNGRASDALRAAASLGPYWFNRGIFAQGRQSLEAPPADADQLCRAKATAWSLRLWLDAGHLRDSAARVRAVEAFEALLTLASESGTAADWMRASEHLSYALRLCGEVDRARVIAERAVARCGDPTLDWWRAEHLHRLALLAEQQSASAPARRYAEEAMAAAERSGNERIRARCMLLLANHERTDGAATTPRTADLLRILDTLKRVGDARGVVTAHAIVGGAAARAGDLSQASQSFEAAIREGVEIGYWIGAALGSAGLVVLAEAVGLYAEAARLHGVVQQNWLSLQRQFLHAHTASYQSVIHRLEAAMGPDDFSRLLAEGSELSDRDAYDQFLSLAALVRSSTRSRGQQPRSGSSDDVALPGARPRQLSHREVEVLELIAGGLTNKEVAAALYLSPKTVMNHTASIYRKLGVRGRVEAVTWATASGLVPVSTSAKSLE